MVAIVVAIAAFVVPLPFSVDGPGVVRATQSRVSVSDMVAPELGRRGKWLALVRVACDSGHVGKSGSIKLALDSLLGAGSQSGVAESGEAEIKVRTK